MAFSLISPGAVFEQRKIPLSRSRLNVSIVRLGVTPESSTKLGVGTEPNVIGSSISPSLVKYQAVSNTLPLLVTRQKIDTFDSFSLLANTTVPPFSTNGIVDSPVANVEDVNIIVKQKKAAISGRIAMMVGEFAFDNGSRPMSVQELHSELHVVRTRPTRRGYGACFANTCRSRGCSKELCNK